MIKKFITITAIIAVIVLGGTGCTMNNFKKSKSQIALDQSLNYMQEKYGETFTHAAGYGDSMAPTAEFLVTCNSLPNQRILVQVENYRTDDPIFRDNYLAVKYQEQVIAMVKDNAAAQGAVVNVFHEARKDGQSENLGANATFEEFLADGRAVAVVMVEMKESDFVDKAQVEQIIQDCAANNGRMNIAVAVVKDDAFGASTRAEVESAIGTPNCVIYLTTNIVNSTVSFVWYDEGKI